ncbi:MAG TPA: YceH family protein [Elusimicrobiales bacterium]|nr:YceH family protein [Elusimicrobiales bacterium]
MPVLLDDIEARVLGALAEKALTVREQYPLTFNSLLAACNQKSSREPVMNLDLGALGRAVQSLIDKGLAERVQAPGDRVPKFRHRISALLGTDDPKITGLFIVLLLRGFQTPGEIKGRSERLCSFESTAEVEGLLQELSARPEPLVARLPRQAGQKETRYRHLFSSPAPAAGPEPEPGAAAAAAEPAAADDRLAALERRVEALEAALKELKGGPADRS